jgi:hypothetical protein
MRRFLPALVSLFVLLVSPRANAAWSTSPYVNLPVYLGSSALTFGQMSMVSDGAGGAFVAWVDNRTQGTTGDDVFAAHILKSGVMDPLWPTTGYVVCAAVGNQEFPVLVADGSGGCIVVWEDHRGATSDIYAERINANGTLASGWLANGKVIGAPSPGGIAREDMGPIACTDGAGGAIVAWTLTFTLNTDYDIYVTRVAANGTTPAGWVPLGQAAVGLSGYQDEPAIAADAAGGAIIVYRDVFLTAYGQIRYRTVNAAGVVTAPASDAVAATGTQQGLAIGVSDGQGGMLVAWEDSRTIPPVAVLTDITPVGPGASVFGGGAGLTIGTSSDTNFPSGIAPDGMGGAYVSWRHGNTANSVSLSHASGNGVVAPGWSTSGVSIGARFYAPLLNDGTGGVLFATTDGYDILGGRYLSNGTLAPGWTSPDYICGAANYQDDPMTCTDGANGLIAVWLDERDLYRGFAGLYAQRIDRFGALGDAAPSSAGIKDTPNDQGGHVRVTWNPSYLDADPAHGINNYYVYRQLPARAAAARLRLGAKAFTTLEDAPHSPGTLRVTPDAANALYWEQIAVVPAMMLPGYSFEASTASDSVPGSNPFTLFMVEATSPSGANWFSAPDSGYSVDNLPPGPPAPIAGAYGGGTTVVHWAANHEADLANYRVYRGSSLTFTPAVGNRVASPLDTTFTDASGVPYIYKVSAVDVHGNESAFSTVIPSGALDAPSDLPREMTFAIISQNPSPNGASLRLALPRDANVRLSVYDAMGRRVKTLAAGSQAAGVHDLRWSGDDEAGRAQPSGLYFARLDAAGRTLVRRLVLAR